MSLFNDAEYSLDDFRLATQRWEEVVKEFSRAELVQTMVDFRGMTEPAYEAASKQLQKMDANDLKRQMRREELEAWASMSPTAIRRLAKRRHKSSKWVNLSLQNRGFLNAKMAFQYPPTTTPSSASNEPEFRRSA